MAKCEHVPIEQVRGEMGPGDYFDVIENRRILLALPEHIVDNFHEWAELDGTNETDVRIICRKCHHTTGWMKMDAPGMPGVGITYCRQKWEEMAGYTIEEWWAKVKETAPRPNIARMHKFGTR